MKLEIDFGKHVKNAREIVNNLIEEAEDTKISIKIERENRTEGKEGWESRAGSEE